jgi:hypothetical protein
MLSSSCHILIAKISSFVLVFLFLLLPLNLLENNINIPNVYAQTINPYNPYYNPYNTYSNPFFLANPTTLALSTAVNAPLVPPFGLQQQISPWFPSIPAIACGTGLFSFTITGVPDKDVNIPMTYDKDKGDDDEKNLLALQILRDNNRFRILDDDVEGQITVGEKNIERQKWKDFEVRDLFNTCRTLAYSSSPDVDKNIKTPLPTMVLSKNDQIPLFPLLSSTFQQQAFPTTDFSSRCPNGYHRSPLGICELDVNPGGLPRCPNGFQRSPLGICELDLT